MENQLNRYSIQPVSSPQRVVAFTLLIVLLLGIGVFLVKSMPKKSGPVVSKANIIQVTDVQAKIIKENGKKYLVIDLEKLNETQKSTPATIPADVSQKGNENGNVNPRGNATTP
jgi:hypothetical protein